MLSVPLTTIINDSLKQSVYPSTWKQEWVTPVPKLSHPKQISDLRKISSTSDYSKLYEGFLKDWIMEDVSKNLDIGQFGGQPGIGTEHMMVCLLDRILKLLDQHPDRSPVGCPSLLKSQKMCRLIKDPIYWCERSACARTVSVRG